MYIYSWYQWLTFFYIYCFFGWIFESTYVSLKERRLVNRGFLRIPMLPIYGTGAVMMLWVSLPVRDNLFLTWASGVIGATVLEYVTGYVMEQLFKVRYWDYSDQKWNLHGYICLSSSIAWGFLTILMTRVLHKPVDRLISSLPVVWILLFLTTVSAIFIYDTVICTRNAFVFGRSLKAMRKLRQDLERLQVQSALLKMETADHFEDARAEFLELLEERYERLPNQAKLRITELKDRVVERKERMEDIRELAELILGGLGNRMEGRLSRTERPIPELLHEREASFNALMKKHHHFVKKISRSNPSVISRLYNMEFKKLQEYIEDGNGHTLE